MELIETTPELIKLLTSQRPQKGEKNERSTLL